MFTYILKEKTDIEGHKLVKVPTNDRYFSSIRLKDISKDDATYFYKDNEKALHGYTYYYHVPTVKALNKTIKIIQELAAKNKIDFIVRAIKCRDYMNTNIYSCICYFKKAPNLSNFYKQIEV